MANASQFLTDLEHHAGRKLHHAEHVGMLFELAGSRGLGEPLLDAAFHAKAAVKTQEVMRRIGPGVDGFDKLSAEFQASLEKTSTLIRTIVKEAPEDVKRTFVDTYLAMDQESLRRMLELCEDLARVKNWEVDGRPLPFTSQQPSTIETHGSLKNTDNMDNLIRTLRLALVLLVLLCIVDAPVTILGWIIAVVVIGLLIIVHFEAVQARKGMA